MSLTVSPPPPGCGLPRPLPQPRSVGGSEAGEGRWPWQGSLRRGGSHVCGVSLVAPQWVLTAAHCLINQYRPVQTGIDQYGSI
uniref:Peptidase S1 domain-containing protein n=1 Tax=Catharus ustulatus TaxID=91951 RepID=A0A8C3V1V4_CATUS